MSTSTSGLYTTQTTLTRTLRVAYPAGAGQVTLRTEQDWDRDIEPVSVSDDGHTSTFRIEAARPFVYFKPCLIRGGVHHWAVGPNQLLLMSEPDRRVCHPFFSVRPTAISCRSPNCRLRCWAGIIGCVCTCRRGTTRTR